MNQQHMNRYNRL